MRNTLRTKAISHVAISGLLVALLCPVDLHAATDDACAKTSKVQPYTMENLKSAKGQYCKGHDQADCQGQLQKYAKIATGFLTDMKSACAANEAAMKAAPSADTQELEKAKGLLNSAEDGSHKLADTAAKRAKEATAELNAGISKLAKPSTTDPSLTAAHSNDINNLKRKLGSPDEVVKESDVSASLQPKVGPLRFGSELRKVLVEAQRDFNATAGTLGDMKKNLDPKGGNGNGNDSPDNSGGKKGGGLMDSLNPSALMGLATAGMGLAAAMKKNNNSSGVSTPSDTTPPAQAVGATGLGGESKSASQSPNMSTTAKTDAPNPSSGGSPAFSASPFTPDSEVTNKSSRQASAGNLTSSSPTSSSGPDGFAGGSGSSRSPDSAAKDPNAGLAKVAEDPMAGGFSAGGGGGGGLNFGSSSSTSSDSMHPEDPLKETLHDMAVAVDNSSENTNTFTDTAQAEAGSQDFTSNNEFLFSRVHSAIQRSLKKGGVVSGLSAKIR